MSLNLERAFTYMFADPQWKKKFLIGGLLMLGTAILQVLSNLTDVLEELKPEQIQPYAHLLPPIFITLSVVLLVSIALSIITSGYFSKNINLRIFKPEANLPEWDNWGDMFFVGFKSNCGALLYVLMFFIPLFILLLVSIGIGVVIHHASPVATVFYAILMILLFIAAILCFCAWLGASVLSFVTDLKFASFFNFDRIKKFITTKFWSFILYLILAATAQIIINILCVILLLTIVGIVLIPFAMYYQCLVVNEIAAQFIRKTLELDSNQE